MIEWTEYLKYRAAIRGFDLEKLEHIIRHSSERYFDTETGGTSQSANTTNNS
jgi:hypothetical protein